MKRLIIIALYFIATTICRSQEIPARPSPPRLVNDFAGIIDTKLTNALEDSLSRFARRTSTQITIVTVNDLGNSDIADFAQQLGEAWGVGQAGDNNGAVIVVKPKTNNSKGRAFIATGYGLEGALPDVTCSRIVNNEMIPSFRDGNYGAGIARGAICVMQAAEGEYTAEEKDTESIGFTIFIASLIFLFIVVFLVSTLNHNGDSHGNSGGGLTDDTMLQTALFGSILASGRRSNWGSFSGGTGTFGGGFGGFGGGSFGGGGGGGSW